jgi:rhodanese-related sulfurtransferase
MKKLMMLAVASMFIFAGCEGKKEEQAQVQAQPAPVAEQPVAKKAPAPSDIAVRVGIKSIDWDKAIEMNANGAIYVDVRNPPELNEGFAPHAVNISLSELKERFGELPKDKDLLIYCRSGRRSEAATKFLMDQGYTRVYNVLGGYNAYPKK